MEGSGGRIIAAALAISGCSLLFLSYIYHKFPMSCPRCVPEESGTASPTEEGIDLLSSVAKNKCSSSAKTHKQVRFSDDVKDPSNNNKDYRRRRRNKVGSSESSLNRERGIMCGTSSTGERNKAKAKKAHLPENRTALYKGLNHYRSQMAILMIYTS